MNIDKKKAIILTGPSGGGKTTLAHFVLDTFPYIMRSVSVTTRSPRIGEKEGVDYYFFSTDEFETHIEQHDFVEWEQVYEGLYYGTLKKEVERVWSLDKQVLFVVDVIGAKNLKSFFGDMGLHIYVRAPDMETLKARLESRGTEEPIAIQKRLKRALGELTYEQFADVVIVNDDLQASKAKIEQTITDFIVKV
jgi:guanylate kinase